MLLNLSNHPSTKWGEKQKNTATEKYGNIQDVPFPHVQPTATSDDIKKLAADYVKQIRNLAKVEKNKPFAVHIMGEMTLVFRIIKLLKRSKITCVASTTFRDTIDNPDGSKTFKFEFIQFREYV
ncbi:MAG: CRISPR-associated protein [Saprospiraceae bacterium]